jgi:hypothetical protein
MKALLQPGSCWLAVVEGQCTVLKVGPTVRSCFLPGESAEQPLNRVQEWLVPVWTSGMLRCTRCLVAFASRTRHHCQGLSTEQAAPRLSSFWIVFLSDIPEIIQVRADGVRLPGEANPIPLATIGGWIMELWGPDMIYCVGCRRAKQRKEAVFLLENSFKGICKECSANLELERPVNGELGS